MNEGHNHQHYYNLKPEHGIKPIFSTNIIELLDFHNLHLLSFENKNEDIINSIKRRDMAFTYQHVEIMEVVDM